jgi:hypothetical protein
MARGCLALSTLLLLARAAVARVHPMSLGQPLVVRVRIHRPCGGPAVLGLMAWVFVQEPTEEDERLMWEEEERRSAELAVGPNSAWQQSSASLEENTAAVGGCPFPARPLTARTRLLRHNMVRVLYAIDSPRPTHDAATSRVRSAGPRGS